MSDYDNQAIGGRLGTTFVPAYWVERARRMQETLGCDEEGLPPDELVANVPQIYIDWARYAMQASPCREYLEQHCSMTPEQLAVLFQQLHKEEPTWDLTKLPTRKPR